jgi:uncharacterized protein
MLVRYPVWNAYWEDKRVQMDKIKIPAYVLASYSTGLHTEGSLRGFEEIQGPKWCVPTLPGCLVTDLPRLRVHPTQEWYDLYSKECNDDLQAFFDKYTKGIDNGWEKTPKVRVSILRFDQASFGIMSEESELLTSSSLLWRMWSFPRGRSRTPAIARCTSMLRTARGAL